MPQVILGAMENTQFITAFSNRVRNLHEVEYGDFKRKLSLYLSRLEGDLRAHDIADRGQLIQQMRQVTIYNPSGDIEGTRHTVMLLADQLASRVKGQA